MRATPHDKHFLRKKPIGQNYAIPDRATLVGAQIPLKLTARIMVFLRN